MRSLVAEMTVERLSTKWLPGSLRVPKLACRHQTAGRIARSAASKRPQPSSTAVKRLAEEWGQRNEEKKENSGLKPRKPTSASFQASTLMPSCLFLFLCPHSSAPFFAPYWVSFPGSLAPASFGAPAVLRTQTESRQGDRFPFLNGFSRISQP